MGSISYTLPAGKTLRDEVKDYVTCNVSGDVVASNFGGKNSGFDSYEEWQDVNHPALKGGACRAAALQASSGRTG